MSIRSSDEQLGYHLQAGSKCKAEYDAVDTLVKACSMAVSLALEGKNLSPASNMLPSETEFAQTESGELKIVRKTPIVHFARRFLRSHLAELVATNLSGQSSGSILKDQLPPSVLRLIEAFGKNKVYGPKGKALLRKGLSDLDPNISDALVDIGGRMLVVNEQLLTEDFVNRLMGMRDLLHNIITRDGVTSGTSTGEPVRIISRQRIEEEGSLATDKATVRIDMGSQQEAVAQQEAVVGMGGAIDWAIVDDEDFGSAFDTLLDDEPPDGDEDQITLVEANPGADSDGPQDSSGEAIPFAETNVGPAPDQPSGVGNSSELNFAQEAESGHHVH